GRTSTPSININRLIKSEKHYIRNSVFVQVMEALKPYIVKKELRQRNKAFSVQFIGEGSTDAGGPYREVLSDMADELQKMREDINISKQKSNKTGKKVNQQNISQQQDKSNTKIGKACFLPLLRPSPNHIDNVGSDRECFILNTNNNEHEWILSTEITANRRQAIRREMNIISQINSASSRKVTQLNERKVEMLRSLGALMSIHIQTRNPMNIMLAKIVWRHIVDEQPTIDDLAAADESFVRSMRRIRDCKNKSEFESYGVEWTVVTQDGHIEDLSLHRPIHSKEKHSSSSLSNIDEDQIDMFGFDSELSVSFEDRHAYCDAAEQFRLQEGASEAAEIRYGLLQLIPDEILLLATGPELEFLVCGEPTISVEDFKKIVQFNFGSQGQLKEMFWEMLKKMTSKQRQLFLRFVTGRSRMPHLPQGANDAHSIPSDLQLKVDLMGMRGSRGSWDQTLPASHTCYQSLELPQYSSADIMLERIVYAITNCVSIDTDFHVSENFQDDNIEDDEEREDYSLDQDEMDSLILN
ncbi:MAG: putative HECT E3 ubiquitin ligase, partial [Streblomastix strix]